MPQPDVSIIIVNFNGAKFIENCLNSIFNADIPFSYDIFIIDNNSSDNSLDVLHHYKDKIKLIKNKVNTGFSYGNNQAIKKSKANHVFLLNNDTILEKNTLKNLWEFAQKQPDAGAITPKLLNKDGSLQCPGSIWGQWRFWSKTPKKVPFIAGAAVLMTRKRYWEMGGLDEHLFFYNDDIDMCKTLKKLGHPIYYCPDSQLIHLGGLSTQFRRVGSLIEGYRGGIYLSLKHYGWVAHQVYRIILLVDIFAHLIIRGPLALFSQHQRDFFMGYLHILHINVTNNVYLYRDQLGQPIKKS